MHGDVIKICLHMFGVCNGLLLRSPPCLFLPPPSVKLLGGPPALQGIHVVLNLSP